jgi:hypothetical protein
MTDKPTLPPGLLTMVPQPVPRDDPRARDAVFAADGAWLNAMQDPAVETIGQAVSLLVRTVLAHLDEVAAQAQPEQVHVIAWSESCGDAWFPNYKRTKGVLIGTRAQADHLVARMNAQAGAVPDEDGEWVGDHYYASTIPVIGESIVIDEKSD